MCRTQASSSQLLVMENMWEEIVKGQSVELAQVLKQHPESPPVLGQTEKPRKYSGKGKKSYRKTLGEWGVLETSGRGFQTYRRGEVRSSLMSRRLVWGLSPQRSSRGSQTTVVRVMDGEEGPGDWGPRSTVGRAGVGFPAAWVLRNSSLCIWAIFPAEIK